MAAIAALTTHGAPFDARASSEPTEEKEATRPPHDARTMVSAWADAWSRQSVGEYLAFYSRAFQPRDAVSRTAWQAERRERIARPRFIEVTLEETHVMVRKDRTEVTFVQRYRSDYFQDAVRKRLVLVWEEGSWKILSEEVLPPLSHTDERAGNHP